MPQMLLGFSRIGTQEELGRLQQHADIVGRLFDGRLIVPLGRFGLPKLLVPLGEEKRLLGRVDHLVGGQLLEHFFRLGSIARACVEA